MSTPAAAAQRAPIPMVVVGGYLGAGKTTLLNRLLERADGLRVAVLVNDFGEINIDAALIRTRSSDVLQLENGCICCSIGGRLAEALAAVGARPDRPDLLVIEASGVSDPVRIAQVGMLDPALQLNAILVAVDVQDVDEQLRDPLVGDMVRRQIAGATALVLTKADLASAPMTGKARQRLAEIAPHTMVLTAQCGEIPLAVFLDAVPLPRQPQHPQRLLGALAGEGGAWKRAVDGSASLAGMAGITSSRTPRTGNSTSSASGRHCAPCRCRCCGPKASCDCGGSSLCRKSMWWEAGCAWRIWARRRLPGPPLSSLAASRRRGSRRFVASWMPRWRRND